MFLFLHLKNIVGLYPWFPAVFEELYDFTVMGNRLLYGVKGKPSRSLDSRQSSSAFSLSYKLSLSIRFDLKNFLKNLCSSFFFFLLHFVISSILHAYFNSVSHFEMGIP